jgi:hypothetical protein
MRANGYLLLLLLSLAVPVKAADAVASALTLEDRRLIEQSFRGLLHYHAITGEGLEDPRALLAPEEGTNLFKVIEEKGADRTEAHRFLQVIEPQGSGHSEYRLNDSESQLLGYTEAKGVVIEGAIDRKEGVRTEFAPAKPLIPRGLLPGASVTVPSKVRVLDEQDATKVRHQGELVVTLTHLGSYRVTIPLGEYEAVLLRLESRGKIGPAEILHRQYYFFAEDTGLLAFLESRKISAFGLYEKKESQATLLEREDGS